MITSEKHKEADTMPRHKKSDPSIVKNHVIRLRVTEAEVEMFKKKAAEAGCRSISEYIRSRCIDDSYMDTITMVK